MYYYIYYSYEEWGRGYIGKRECKCLPEEDEKYFGSYKDKTFNPNQKIILFVCDTREESYEIEMLLHDLFEVDINPHFANKSRQKALGFSFSASGEKNPNYGGGRKTPEGLKKISECTRIRLTDWEENPFRLKGELSMSHGRKWVTNEDKSEEIYLKPGEEVPNGWKPGRMKRPPRSEESRKRTSESLKGKPKSEEHKEKLRKATLEFYKNLRKER